MMHRYKDIDYALKRSRRKTASIYIERDGQVSVLVPEALSDDQIEALIENKRRWIYRNLAEWRDLNARQAVRDYVNGEGFLYLGRSYRLQYVEVQSEPLLLKGGYFCLRRDCRPDAEQAFKTFYRDKGGIKIRERMDYYQPQMGVKATGIRVRELKHRWASCSAGGWLNFHWKCMMAPLTVLDYIVVHELAHLIHPNHTPSFWREVDKILPDHQARREWLKRNGAGMSL